MGRRRAAGFADGHAGSRQGQLPEVDGQAACRCENAPDEDRYAYDDLARAPVCQRGHGNSGDGINKREHHACQQAKLGVAQQQIVLDRLDQNKGQLAVDEAERVGQHQYIGDVPGIK